MCAGLNCDCDFRAICFCRIRLVLKAGGAVKTLKAPITLPRRWFAVGAAWAMGTPRLSPLNPIIRIHAAHDTRKIGRCASNGCICLYSQHIAELIGMTKLGAQVLLI